jgi:UPF0755 protein
MLRAFFISLGLGLLAAILLGFGAILWYQDAVSRPGPATIDGASRTVAIPSGAGSGRIGILLRDAGAITDANLFRLASRIEGRDGDLKAGEFEIPSGASLLDTLTVLAEGRAILHPIAVPEGLTTAMILRIVARSDVLTGDMPEDPIPEGALSPDTYMVVRGDTRQSVIDRMREARDTELEMLWANRQPNLPFKTPQEALILASIVEKETGMDGERGDVAAVFVNRLRRGMRLESDPTIIYGISFGEPLGRGLRRSEIDRKTDWNTYQIDGLPPTPICNPGTESLIAVLNPPDHGYLFFVADGTGGHAFSKTYAEHRRKVADWRLIEAERRARAPDAQARAASEDMIEVPDERTDDALGPDALTANDPSLPETADPKGELR